jgi:phosphopantothenoylcysteine decarboxylase/phosphopantothenate--cysteine ligase
MYHAAVEHFSDADAAILSAAVADYRPESAAEQKIKRTEGENLTLTLIPNPDIAAALGKMKKPGQKIIGFALETHNEEAHATKKMEQKNLDYIVLNSLQDQGAGFGYDTNKVTILTREGKKITFGLKSKKEVARDIIDTALRQL